MHWTYPKVFVFIFKTALSESDRKPSFEPKKMHIVFRSLRRAKVTGSYVAGHAVAWASCPLMRASLSVRMAPPYPPTALEHRCFFFLAQGEAASGSMLPYQFACVFGGE